MKCLYIAVIIVIFPLIITANSNKKRRKTRMINIISCWRVYPRKLTLMGLGERTWKAAYNTPYKRILLFCLHYHWLVCNSKKQHNSHTPTHWALKWQAEASWVTLPQAKAEKFDYTHQLNLCGHIWTVNILVSREEILISDTLASTKASLFCNE